MLDCQYRMLGHPANSCSSYTLNSGRILSEILLAMTHSVAITESVNRNRDRDRRQKIEIDLSS
jgi:hypothetical protein